MHSGRTGWPRGECGEVLINMFCVRGFKIHPCRLVFQNTEHCSVSTKTDIYLIFLMTHQKFVRSQKIGKKISSQTIGIHLSRLFKQVNVVHKENRMANVIRFSIETIQGMEI